MNAFELVKAIELALADNREEELGQIKTHLTKNG